MSVKEYIETQNSDSKSLLAQGNDIFLAVALVSIVALMILPVSTWMLDILVAINIIIGLMLVLMGIYISSPLQFSVFPSVLLISTLYRLSLSVATTRMILLEGDAGNIINAFGGFVAGGNIIVGLVVFLIITIVQFIVIAKGAERVAEVGARFSLDAMPGKQMSIDSDLRSGLIDKDEARKKRRDLELEAKLHGSMDGAMKFVKGDAIAGIVIIIVNLLGGLTIGVLQLDMGMSEAMSKYSILTVGDGMVAQVPALLGALSAGLIVTRVTDTKNDGNLADSIKQQISAVPRASLIAGAICFFFALVPGFPSATFVVLGGLLLLAGTLLTPGWKQGIQRVAAPAVEVLLPKMNTEIGRESHVRVSPIAYETVPVLLSLAKNWSTPKMSREVAEEINLMQSQLIHDLGLKIPDINIHWRLEGQWEWELLAYEVPIAQGGSQDLNRADQLSEAISLAVRRNARIFLGLQEASNLVSQASNASPDIVREALRLVSMQNLAAIFRNLVEESISIRNMRAILEAIVEVGQSEKDINNLTEHVRGALSRQTSHKIAPLGLMRIVLLAPELEHQLAGCIRIGNGRIELSMDPSDGEKIVQKLSSTIQQLKPDAVITNVQLRKCVRMLIEAHCFETPVLSHGEITRNMQLEVLGSIDLPESERLQSA